MAELMKPGPATGRQMLRMESDKWKYISQCPTPLINGTRTFSRKIMNFAVKPISGVLLTQIQYIKPEMAIAGDDCTRDDYRCGDNCMRDGTFG